MIIVNADDWGRSQAATRTALSCVVSGQVASVGAMVFMEDSKRAAALARDMDLDVGLHLNFLQTFSEAGVPQGLFTEHQRIVRFLSKSKYAVALYHPFLRREFQNVYTAQVEEFVRLYGKPPSHINGHHHAHLCANMLLDEIIPHGLIVRRGFSFMPGEKGWLNRAYRDLINKWLSSRYGLTDYFFSLRYCMIHKRLDQVTKLSKTATVELMVHPENAPELAFLQSDEFARSFQGIDLATFTELGQCCPSEHSC